MSGFGQHANVSYWREAAGERRLRAAITCVAAFAAAPRSLSPDQLTAGQKMSLTDLASLGSFVSGVAVVISFGFLGLQIRQNNRNQRSLIQQGRADNSLDLMLRLTEPHLQESMMRGRAGDLTMTAAQIDAFVRAWIATFSIWEDSFLQRQHGTIDRASLAADAANHRVYLAFPGCRAAWRTVRGQFTGPFQAYLDEMVRDTPPAAPPDVAMTWKSHVADDVARIGLASV